MESILELGVPYGKGEFEFSFSGDSVEQKEFKTVQLPIIYKENKNGSFNSESVYESMALSSVVVHNGTMYRLRMPNAKNKIAETIKVTVNDGVSERNSERNFNHEIGSILNYRRTELERGGDTPVPKDMLDPSYDAEKDVLSNANKYLSLIHI